MIGTTPIPCKPKYDLCTNSYRAFKHVAASASLKVDLPFSNAYNRFRGLIRIPGFRKGHFVHKRS